MPVEKVKVDQQELTVVHWPPAQIAQFAAGRLTLAQLQGLSREKLYEMAQVGYHLMEQGKLEDARKIYDGLALMDPYDPYFQLVLGSIEQRNHRPERAEQHYTRALQINASLIPAYVNRGEVRILLGKLGDAVADFIKAASLDPQNQNPDASRARVMLIAINQKIEQIQQKQSPKS